jgi:hypothetical protein
VVFTSLDDVLKGYSISAIACIDPLLGNEREINNETTAARQHNLNRQQLNYRGAVFSMRSVSRCYKQDNWSN